MSEARFRRVLLLIVLLITFYLPGTLAFAAPNDHEHGNQGGNGNGHGQGQDSPDDHDNGYGNDDHNNDDPPDSADPAPTEEVETPDQDPAPTDNPGEPGEEDPELRAPAPDLQPEPIVSQVVDAPTEEPPADVSDNQPQSQPTESVAPNEPGRSGPASAQTAPPAGDQTDLENGSDSAAPDGPPIPNELHNEPPVATPGQTVVFAGSTTTIDLSTFVVDGDGDSLELTSHSLPIHGTLTVTNGVALFTPEPGFFGVEKLHFTACDPSGACIDTTVSVFVPPVNDILIATNDPEILSRFMVGADQGLSNAELVADLLTRSATRLAVPMAGAVSVIGGSLLFGLHKIGTRFDLLRLLFRRN